MIRKIAMLLIFSLVIIIPYSSFALDNHFGQHFTISMVLGAIGETAVHKKENINGPMKIVVGTVLGSVPGLIKELDDSNDSNNYFSGDQMLYDIAGSAVGSVIAYKLNSRTKVNVSGTDGGATISLLYSY